MADLLEFPRREKQAFQFLQEQLAALLRRKGADEALITYATASLTDVYGELQRESDCQFELRLPSALSHEDARNLQEDIASRIDAMRIEHHDLTLKLAARLMLTELRLFQHERTD